MIDTNPKEQPTKAPYEAPRVIKQDDADVPMVANQPASDGFGAQSNFGGGSAS